MKKTLLIFSIALLGVACGEPTSDPDNPTKEELAAQGKADGGQDWCEALGWYGDGICDTFCLNPDPDCDGDDIDCTTAFVVPHCDAGYDLVDETTCGAAGEGECETSELCGVTSHCLFVGEFCPQVVGTPPECATGTNEVETCQTSECEIVRGSGDDCTQYKLCEPEVDCTAALVNPTCDSNELSIDALACSVAGPDECRTITQCGVSVHCLFVGDACPQVVGTPATCDADMIEVESCQSEQCEIVRGTGDDCTDIALCEPAVNCLAIPTCEIGEINVGTQACSERGESCRNVTTCGQTIHCWDYPKFCPQVVGTPPTCGAGFSEVGGCNTPQLNDGTCKLVSGTGDKCSTYIYCAAD